MRCHFGMIVADSQTLAQVHVAAAICKREPFISGSKMVPRGLQEGPREVQEGPRGSQGGLQEALHAGIENIKKHIKTQGEQKKTIFHLLPELHSPIFAWEVLEKLALGAEGREVQAI